MNPIEPCLLSIEFLKPPPILRANASRAFSPRGAALQNRLRAVAKREARQRAKIIASDAIQYHEVVGKPASYVIYWYYKGIKPDSDNVLSSCKSYLDGIADAFNMNDKDLDCAGIERVHLKGKDAGLPRVLIQLFE